MRKSQQRALLQRFEPVLRFTQGERFFPFDVARYIEKCSLWVDRRGQGPERLASEGELSLDKLGQPRFEPFNSVQYLKFIEPFNVAELAAYSLRRGLSREARRQAFHAGPGRLSRVGYGSRLLDAIFSLSLLARGRVPGDTAAAAAVTYANLQRRHESYTYYGRVIELDGWLVLQYWFFYPFNNWRSGFFGVNDHEGDWEMLTLYLYRDGRAWKPEWVALANHDFEGENLRRRWDDPDLERQGDHLVVYAGAGSHAGYFQPGEYLAEVEIPLLSPLAALVDRLRRLGSRLFGEQNATAENEGGHLFHIPFVDYARGDGLSLGPGQAKNWEAPQLISEETPWVGGYRGLWGLWAHDPVMGENAPGGPRYDRFGRVRHAWYDPLGWAGVDKHLPPTQQLPAAQARLEELDQQRAELEAEIVAKEGRLRRLGLEAEALQQRSHMKAIFAEHQARIAALSGELAALRAELAQGQAIADALRLHARRIEKGYKSPPQAHLRRVLQPASDAGLRLGRIAETWAAISIGLMMLAFVGIVLFAPHYKLLGSVAAIGLIVVVEAAFRRRLGRFISGVTNLLATFTALVLFIEFFWSIVIILILLAGGYIMWENLRELWS